MGFTEAFKKDRASFKEVQYLMTATTMLYLTGCIKRELRTEIEVSILNRSGWSREEFEDERERNSQ